MKNILFALVLIFTLFISCEKKDFTLHQLDGAYFSNPIILADLEKSIQINLFAKNDSISHIYLTPLSYKYEYSFELLSIDITENENILICFNFQSPNIEIFKILYIGTLSIRRTDSYCKLEGYLKIRKYKDGWIPIGNEWIYELDFNSVRCRTI